MFVNFNILNQLGSPAINSNTFANRPAAGQTGRLFVSTDTFEIYRDNGTTWDLIGGPGTSTITGTGTATQVAYFTSSQAIGSSANLYWDNTNTRLGIGTSTPGVRLDIHGTGNMLHINSTSATANALMSFQRTGTNVWRLGDQYNGGSNFFELHNTALANNAIQIDTATNKSILTSIESYSTGLARGNYLDYTLSLPNGTTFTSPNTVTALGATLNLNIAGSATIPAGARSGADFFNGINFTSAGTFTVNQSSTIRAFSNVTAGWAFNGSAVGTVTHLAGLRVLFPTNSGSAINVTDNYALLINNQNANTGTITYTNRWGIYQEGASDLNYFAANTLIGTTVNSGEKLIVSGSTLLQGAVNNNIVKIINSDTTDGNGLLITSQGTASGKYAFSVRNNAESSTYLQVNTDTGKVGWIGFSTNNPLVPYHFAFRQGEGDPTTFTGERLRLQGNDNNGRSNFMTIISGSNSYGGFYVGDNSNAQIGKIRYYNLDNSWEFHTNDTIKATLTSGGNLLVGTTTDAGQKLQVNGTASFSNTVSISASVAATGNATLLNLSNGSDGGVKINFSNSVTTELASIIAAVTGTGSGTDDGKLIFRTSLNDTPSDQLTISSSGAATFSNTITTAAPTTGTAAPWKLGSRVAATVVVNTTEYIEVDIGGTLYKLATVT